MLCKSWLEISCDPVVNTGQRKEAFWIRVLNRYNSKCGSYPTRTQKSIMSCWDHIKAEVSKFFGYMAEMIRSNPSGMSDADKSVVAAADFASVEKHNFTLMHCWQIMKDEPKWMELKKKMDTPQNSGSRETASPLVCILAINLDQCLPMQRMYYQVLQEVDVSTSWTNSVRKLVANHVGVLCNLGSSKYN